MKVLYLAPLLPAPSGSGGKRAIYNHLEDMLGEDASVDAFFVDVESGGEHDLGRFASFAPQVFARAMPKFAEGFKGKIAAIGGLAFNSLPRSLAVVASKAARKVISTRLAAHAYDVVIVDHLNAYAMLHGLPLSIPVIYVAHNVESEILKQAAARLPAGSLRRFAARIDLARMSRIETALLAKAAKVVLIGAADAALPEMRRVAEKVVFWPELPQLKTPHWTHPGTKRLLFVGSAKYFPNKDAIEWLAERLLPAVLAVDPEITLDIAGTTWAEIGSGPVPAGVTFHGFVSDEVLDDLHRNAAMFICPVVLGAGIKIKMLEAASYGLPSAATPASLAGISFLDGIALRIARDDPEQAAREIAALLADAVRLNALGAAGLHALTAAIAARASLLDHARAVLPTNVSTPK
jgi:polysaccharide biosynthesis protein PslH